MKNSHCRIADMTLEALALVHLNPCVTRLDDLRSASPGKHNLCTDCSRKGGSYQFDLKRNKLSDVGFNRYGHTDTDTDTNIVIQIYSKPILILPSRIYIKPIPIPISG